jgi:ATP dependent DNA ligase-like protein
VHWIEPKLVAEIAYLTWTADGLVRHTVFVGVREDKPATDVRGEAGRLFQGQPLTQWSRSDADLAALPGQRDSRQGPSKTSRPDTATRMAMDADFSDRRESMPPELRHWRERDDGHLVKPAGPLADVDPLVEPVRIVNEAQERDAEDERRLYHPMRGDRPSFFQRRRPDRR